MRKPEKDQKWVRNESIEGETTAPGVVRKLLAYTDGIMCVENSFAAGAVGKLHSHPHTQLTYVAKGSFEFTIGEEIKVVKTGDTLLKQDGIVHGCVCLEDGILVDVFTPVREDFL